MVKALPVIQDESSLAKKSARFAISAGCPNFFINVALSASDTAFCGSGKAIADSWSKGVSTGPGQMLLIRISGP